MISNISCLKTKEPYIYQVYGLRIECDFAVPELLPAKGWPDVFVVFGKVPRGLEKKSMSGEYWQFADNQLLFQVPGLASFYIKNGDSITVEPCQSADMRDIRLYLLGSAFGALLFQRGVFYVNARDFLIILFIFARLWPRFSSLQVGLQYVAMMLPAFRAVPPGLLLFT